MMAGNLRRVFLRVVLVVEDGPNRLGLVRAGDQEKRVLRREQDSRKQRNPPLIELGDEDGGGDTLAVIDQRVAGKETGGVRIGAHPAVDEVEARHLAAFESEMLPDVFGI